MSNDFENVVDLGRVFNARLAPDRKMFAVVQRKIVASCADFAACAFHGLFTAVKVVIHHLNHPYKLKDFRESLNAGYNGKIIRVFRECADAEIF